MFISVTDNDRKKLIRQAVAYAAATVFCIVFSVIYEAYSHNVYSGYMIFMFLFPLAGGLIPSACIAFSQRIPVPGRLTRNIINSAIATLTVGSCFSGILEIYGTTSYYSSVYWAVGCVLAAIGLFTYIIMLIDSRKH